MAQPATVEEFIDLVRKSGVADEKRLDAYLAKMRANLPAEPAKAAGFFVQDGIITKFQADNILQGKWRRFSIGKYKVLEKLGSGGFAQVYLCEHKLMRRRVAVKVLPVAKAKDSSAKERFYREARAAAELDHPNIVHTYDIDQDEDLHFLVMEFVDGSNLQDILQRSGPLSVGRACHYIHEAALALQHAHEHGLVHRDIKPGNILVDRAGVVKILDMGLALILSEEDEQLTKKHDDGTIGTADYLSPEQAMDSHDVDIRTDIYSLGVTFYFLLTGRAPFDGMPITQKLLAHQMKQPKSIAEFRKDVPTGVLAIIDKMMAKKKGERYAVPGEVADALAAYAGMPIAPPSDAEMPKLSPAATGMPSSDAAEKHDSPRAAPRSAKGVAPGGNPPPASSGAGKPKPPAPAPVPVATYAPPLPKPAQAATADAVTQEMPWEQYAGDTDHPAAYADTPSSLPRSGNAKKARRTRKDSVIVVVLVLAFVVIPLCLTAAIFTGLKIFYPSKEPPAKRDPVKLFVSKDPSRKGAQRTIQAALRLAEADSVIELLDDVYEENVVVPDPLGKRTNVTLQAAEGKGVIWRSARKDAKDPILKIQKANRFKLKGKGITFDGALENDGMVNELILINFESPGLEIEDAQFRNFARSGVFIMNSGGTEKTPMKLSRLFFTSDAPEKTRGAIYFDANPKVLPPVNDFIEIDDCIFGVFGPDKAIQSKDKSVNGGNVRW